MLIYIQFTNTESDTHTSTLPSSCTHKLVYVISIIIKLQCINKPIQTYSIYTGGMERMIGDRVVFIKFKVLIAWFFDFNVLEMFAKQYSVNTCLPHTCEKSIDFDIKVSFSKKLG